MEKLTVTLKPLKTRTYQYADGGMTVERFAVRVNGVRIGTVNKCITRSGKKWFDPLIGKGEGKSVVLDSRLQYKKTMQKAVEAVVEHGYIRFNK